MKKGIHPAIQNEKGDLSAGQTETAKNAIKDCAVSAIFLKK